jgi:cytochrome P450/nitrite reductase/ring-hydroxylating ferredoxin subunit
MGQKIHVAHVQELQNGTPIATQVEGVELVVVPGSDSVAVFEGRCPHQGTLLAEGTLQAGVLTCRAHGWRFDCASGMKLGDARVCLQPFTVSIENAQIMVDRDEVLDWQQARQEREAAAPSTSFAYHTLQALPSPKGLPLLGNSLQLDMKQLHRVLEQWGETYGPLFRFNIGTKPVVVIADPALANEIMRDRPAGVRRMGTIEPVLRELGVNGVFSAEGANWRRQRHLVMQALDTRHLRQFFPTLIKVTQRLKQRWTEAAHTHQSVDVQKDLMRYTVDVTTSLAFGYDMNTLEEEGDIIQQHLEKIFPIISRRVFAAFPYWRYLRLSADRGLDRALVEVRKTIDDFIDHGRTRLAQDPDLAQHPTNLLEAMLAARDEANAHFSDDEVFGNVFTMLLAGEDTTANTLAWVMHFMTDQADVQGKMQAEADAVLGHADRLHDYQDARKLAYIEAVAYETMRLKPVAPILAFETNTHVEIGTLRLPPETSIIVLTRPSALDEPTFAQAATFHPDRWLAPDSSRDLRHHKAFMPFGSGPRLCPGRSLALLEMQTALAMIGRNFHLTQVPQSQPVGELFAFTMMPTNLRVIFAVR